MQEREKAYNLKNSSPRVNTKCGVLPAVILRHLGFCCLTEGGRGREGEGERERERKGRKLT